MSDRVELGLVERSGLDAVIEAVARESTSRVCFKIKVRVKSNVRVSVRQGQGQCQDSSKG